MKQFDLYEPTSVSDATGLLQQLGPGAKVVAGGSDLLGGVMKDWVQGKGMPYPAQLIDLTTIPDLAGVKSGADGFHIGANTTLTDIVEHPQAIADRLVRYAKVVGRENVMAGTDCGLGPRVGSPQIAWAKFEAMAEGARLASKELWGR